MFLVTDTGFRHVTISSHEEVEDAIAQFCEPFETAEVPLAIDVYELASVTPRRFTHTPQPPILNEVTDQPQRDGFGGEALLR